MDNKKANIKERVLQVAKYEGISYENFSVEIGMTYASFKGQQKNTPINSSALEILISKYPHISAEWLLTGNGPMTNESRTAIQRAADEFASKTQRLADVGNRIFGTVEEHPGPTSTNEARLWSMIENMQHQLADQQETIKTQARTIEKMASKGAAADAPGVAGKVAKG